MAPGKLSGTQPDITLTQIIATVLAAIGLAVAFGLHITKDQQDHLVNFITVGYPGAMIADAWLRGKRNEQAAALHNLAAAQIRNLPPDGVDTAPPVA